MSILVIGSLNMDITIHTERVPKMGETVVGHNFSTQGGGKGGNQAVAVSKLGGDVKFLGAVSDDIFGKKLLDNLEKNNIEFYGNKASDAPTGTAVITVCEGDNCIILNPGANDFVTENLIKENEKLFYDAQYVVMQLEIPIKTVVAAAKMAKKHNCKVVLNPAPYKDMPKELLENVDILIPNEHEAALITQIEINDKPSALKAIEKIRDMGVNAVIITLGSEGCVYSDGKKTEFFTAKKANCVDTTAAGDTFIGGFITMLSKGNDFEKSIEFATSAAAITVSRYGAADSIPYFDEVIM